MSYLGNCRICGCCSHERKLICDHNHETKYIRGLICDRCNSWICLYEKGPIGPAVAEWSKIFEVQILVYLAYSTGIPWQHKCQWRNKMPQRKGPWMTGLIRQKGDQNEPT